jgi:hypothetical protein
VSAVQDEPADYHVREYAFFTPELLGGEAAYRRVCAAAGVPPLPGGYGVIHSEDSEGRQVTALTRDLDFLRMLLDTQAKVITGDLDYEAIRGMRVPPEKFPIVRAGWPDEWPSPPAGLFG